MLVKSFTVSGGVVNFCLLVLAQFLMTRQLVSRRHYTNNDDVRRFKNNTLLLSLSFPGKLAQCNPSNSRYGAVSIPLTSTLDRTEVDLGVTVMV